MSEGKGAASAAPTLPELADGIRTELGAIEIDNRSALAHAIRAGELLIQAKAQVEHGEWLLWLEKEFPGDRSTAANYMRMADPANVERVLHLGSVREALAAIAEAKPKRKTKKRGEPTVTGIKGLAQDPAVIDWVRTQTRRGLGSKEVVAASVAGEDDWPGKGKSLTDGTLASCRAAIVAEDRVRAEYRTPKKTASEGGKRLRQLHADKRAGRRDPEDDLWKMQVSIAETIGVLERIELPDVEWNESVGHLLNEVVYDLERHRAWSDRQFDAVWARMDDVSRQRKLGELRKRVSDPSSTQSERETAASLLEKQERKYREQKELA